MGPSGPLTCDRVCVQPAAEGEDVQLIQPGNLLQELPAVRTQAGVQHRLAPAQLEVQDALRSGGGVSRGAWGLGTLPAGPTWPQPTATAEGTTVTTFDRQGRETTGARHHGVTEGRRGRPQTRSLPARHAHSR